MSADKRTVSTDALETLGTIIDENQKRDAIHLAVMPVLAGEDLLPGEHISISKGKAFREIEGQGIGIVDPFLTHRIELNQHFWCVIYPRKITSLRHVWSHPAFDEEVVALPQKKITYEDISKKWIEDYAASIGLGYSTLMDGAKNYLDYDDYLSLGGLLEGESVPAEFWTHYAVVTGKDIPSNKRHSFFSCSC